MNQLWSGWRNVSLLPLVLMLVAGVAQARELPDFTHLVDQNSAAVVNISTTQKVKRHPQLPPGLDLPDIPEDSPWGELLRKFFDQDGEGPPPRDYQAESLGSGCIIDPAGFVLTNYHVVKDAEEIIVRLNDRRELVADVVGYDERSDLALLKINATHLPVVKIGRSRALKVGEWVMAIGSPFGFDHSVSVGVVSAKGRSLPSETYVPFIQTDVAINPGNSGGPLINLDGEVVGINSQIFSRTGGFMGLSFAIPIDVAMDVVKQLKSKGYVSRGWLGILIQDVNRELAESFGMDKPMGAVVLRVLPDSPAAKAGLKVGDVVVQFNGHDIEYSSDLPVIVGQAPVGSTGKVKAIRDGKTITLQVPIEELPEEVDLAGEAQPASPSEEVKANRLGLAVTDLSSDDRGRYGIDKGGVLVKDVDNGPAMDAGIRAGDAIVMFNRKDVKNAEQLRKLIADLPAGKAVPVLVQRPSGPVFLALKVPEEG